MDNRFDSNSVYGMDGEQLNGLDAAMRQLCALRTLTFHEQRDLAERLQRILAQVVSAPESAEHVHAEQRRETRPTSQGTLPARVRRAQLRSVQIEPRRNDQAAGGGGAVRVVRKRVNADAG